MFFFCFFYFYLLIFCQCFYIESSCFSFSFCSDHFYQFGEIREIRIVQKQNCAFVTFTTRQSAETAVEKSFNSLIIKGRRLRIMWGRGQGGDDSSASAAASGGRPKGPPVPGLPGGK